MSFTPNQLLVRRNYLAKLFHRTNILGYFLLMFVGLKLTGYIDWSWWWIMSPFILHVFLVTVDAFTVSRVSKDTSVKLPVG